MLYTDCKYHFIDKNAYLRMLDIKIWINVLSNEKNENHPVLFIVLEYGVFFNGSKYVTFITNKIELTEVALHLIY